MTGPRRLCATDLIIAGNLRRLRLERGLSQDNIAALLGVSYQQVQKYESGANRISLPRLMLLRDFYGVTLEDMIGPGTATPNRAPPPITDPDVMRICHKIATIKDRSLRAKADRMIDVLLSHG